jgi:hypothetical protein
MKRTLWLLAMPALALAQIAPVQLTTPALGYVFDANARALRVLEGVPGAALVGHEVSVGIRLDEIQVAPNRRYALGAVAGEDRLYLIKLSGPAGVAHRTGLAAGSLAFSPRGETLAIAAQERVEVWTGVPERPMRASAMELGSLAGAVDKLAVSDDGSLVLVLSGGALWRLETEREPKPLGEGYSDAVFFPLSHKVAAASREHSRIDIFHKADEEWTTIASSRQGLHRPFAVALSADERMILALNQDSRLTAFDRESGESLHFSLDAIPASGLWRAEGSAVFQLTRSAAQQVWVFDGDSATARLVAVERREQQ